MTTLAPAVAVGLSGSAVDHYALLAGMGAVAAGLVILMRRSPRASFLIWLCVVAFVPIWFSVHLKVDFPPATAVGLVALVALIPTMPRKLLWADFCVGCLLVVCVAPVFVGGATRTTVFTAILQWGLGYLLGRLFPLKVGLPWIYGCLTAVFAVVSVGALIEFFSGWNPFVLLARNNALFRTWSGLQERGGIVRAEGAFGHSIALGACVALVIPIVMTCALKAWLRTALTLLLLGAAVVSFSRIGIGCSLLGVLMGVVFLSREMPTRLRVALVGCLAGLAAALESTVATVFADAGQEAVGSADYRLNLSALLPDMSVLGLSHEAYHNANGDLYFGQFRSIDSAVLLLGLTYGVLALLLAIVLYFAAVKTVFSRRAAPATISVVAQLPALLTVALITQYAIFLWFFIGLAVASQSLRRQSSAPDLAKSTTAEWSANVNLDWPRTAVSSGLSPTVSATNGVAHRGTPDQYAGH